jgi:hypothetical protein
MISQILIELNSALVKIQRKKELYNPSYSTSLNSIVICTATAAWTSRKSKKLADLLGRWWNWFVCNVETHCNINLEICKKKHLAFRKVNTEYRVMNRITKGINILSC